MLSNETNKRKAPDDESNADANGVGSMSAMSNPLINAAKKAKRESKAGASNKRKLANAEEAPGGLLIVRTQIPSSIPAAIPPVKKFKSSQILPQSQPLPSTSTKPPSSKSKSKPPSFSGPSSQPANLARYNTPDADPALDAAVRAMDTEAADLRRSSRTPQTPDTSRSGSSSGSNLNPKFRFPTQTVANSNSNRHGNGNGNGNGKRRETERERIIDVSAPLRAEEDETPQIQRNKNLRAGAMAALTANSNSNTPTHTNMDVDPITPPRRPSGSAPGSQRRKSSVGGRGKRISSSFQATGVITQPHNSVADSSFYKHIDSDLPDSDRIRQLLIWCSARAASSSSSLSDPPSSLPPLSAKAEAVLKATQEDIVRKLAERYVDLIPDANEITSNGDDNVKENKQNVTNRTWEGVYSGHIQSAVEEEQAWKQVSSAYDAYARRIRSSMEKRRAELGIPTNTSTTSPTSLSAPTPTPDTGTVTPSAKAQGKQRALAEPREQDLPERFQAGFRLARKVLARSRTRRKLNQNQEHAHEQDEDQSPGAGPSTRRGVDPDSRLLPSSQGYDVDAAMEEDTVRKEVEAEEEEEKALDARMRDVEFKLDHLYVMASQARQTTEVAELALDWWFEVLRGALDARRRPVPRVGSGSGSGSGESGVTGLGRYLRSGAGSNRDREEADEALSLLRALARVDAARPPAQVGDAARRAVREVQRVGDAGGVGERKITEVPVGVGLTPRKVPGTPRRSGSTPGRGG